MSDFRMMTLAQAGVRLIDCDHRTPRAQSAGLPYVGIPQMKGGHIDFSDARLISEEDFRDWTRKARPQRYDVILSRRTNPGVVAVDRTNTPFALGQNLVLLRPDGSKVHPPFLRWLCQSPAWWEQIEKFINVGAVFSSLRCADVPKFEVPIPDQEMQEGIAATLDALDDKIELNRRTATTLEEMARALWRSWFVDFDPVQAHVLGRAPAFIDEATAALFPDRFGADGLPEGWRIAAAEETFDIVMGQSPPGDTYNDDGLGPPFFQGRTDFGDRFPTNRKYCSAPTRLAKRDSILLSVRAPVGDLNRAWSECCIGRGVAALNERQGRNSFGYYALMQMGDVFKSFDQEGTVFGAINKKQVAALEVIEAPNSIVDRFESITAPMDAQIRVLTEQSRTLAALRDALLPRLMSGELRVREAEALVEEVA